MNDRTPETRAERIARARQDLAQRYEADPEAVRGFEQRMARIAAARKRERQRVELLALGHNRPVERVRISARKGKRKRMKTIEAPVKLEPGIEEAVQLREAWSHKRATPETMAAASRTHQGALAQLHANGTISNDQLEWAAEIANVHRSIEADVKVAIASLEARVDQSRTSRALVAEGIKRVRLHLAYTRWRDQIPAPKQLVLDMIVGDAIGFTVAAKRYRVHNRKAKRLLLEALDRWPESKDFIFRTVSDDEIIETRNAA